MIRLLLLLIVLAALYIYAVSAQDIAIAISVPVGIGLLFATNAAINIAEESRQIYHRSWDRPISGETEHTATQTLDNATSATNDQSEGEEQVSAEIDPNDYEPQVVLEKLRAQEHPNQKNYYGWRGHPVHQPSGTSDWSWAGAGGYHCD